MVSGQTHSSCTHLQSKGSARDAFQKLLSISHDAGSDWTPLLEYAGQSGSHTPLEKSSWPFGLMFTVDWVRDSVTSTHNMSTQLYKAMKILSTYDSYRRSLSGKIYDGR